jgi:hypothetical protein
MPLNGEYQPSRNDRTRKQVELYEATKGVEGGTFNGKTGHCPDLQGCQVGQDSQDASDEDRTQRDLCGRPSNDGAPAHPFWNRNIVANPVVELQDGALKHEMRAREVFGEEKGGWWKRADAAYSEFPAFRARAGREIPVLVLKPLPA